MQELLAKAYTASKQQQKAISLVKAIVKTREETEEAESADTLWSYNELESAYVKIGQFEEATNSLSLLSR